MTYYLLGVATGVAVTYGVIHLDKIKTQIEAWRKK